MKNIKNMKNMKNCYHPESLLDETLDLIAPVDSSEIEDIPITTRQDIDEFINCLNREEVKINEKKDDLRNKLFAD